MYFIGGLSYPLLRRGRTLVFADPKNPVEMLIIGINSSVDIDYKCLASASIIFRKGCPEELRRWFRCRGVERGLRAVDIVKEDFKRH